MARPTKQILELAKRGAELRVRELLDELKLLADLFPNVRDSFDKEELPLSFIIAKGSGQLKEKPSGRRHRRRMSAAQKKAVSVRMKKYWAERRKAENV